MTDMNAIQHQLLGYQQEVSKNFNELNRIVGGLVSSVTTLTATWAHQDGAATEGRRILHDKLDEAVRSIHDLANKLTDLTSRVRTMEDQVNIIEPSVEAFKNEKMMKKGAEKLGAKLWFAVCAGSGVLGFSISELVAWWKH
jgi:hypothetical protein